MPKRFISIWFRYLRTDWFARRQGALRDIPFVLSAPSRGRMIIAAVNSNAQAKGIYSGMALADARALVPTLRVFDDKPGLEDKVLHGLAEWSIRFTPFVSIDPLGGLILDVTGCSHLWGGDEPYLQEIIKRLKAIGYHVQAAMADTIGAAWALARYGEGSVVIETGKQIEALLALPPEALRLDIDTIERLHKLGLRQIKDFLSMPGYSLSRRFGAVFIQRLHQALGLEEEIITPLYPVESYQERLTSLEPIVTATGIEIALQRLLEALCHRLHRKQKGLRGASFIGYRIDAKIERVHIATGSPSYNVAHLFKLFQIQLPSIEPALGIELFVLEAHNIEDHAPVQEKLWRTSKSLNDSGLSELLDRFAARFGGSQVHRYLPDEHYLPERSFRSASSLQEKTSTEWKVHRPRPMQLLSPPQLIEVTAPIPDYPPMLFRYKGKLHKIMKADGPERIEQEWWISEGGHRDYYYVEDEAGYRYWLFRSGHYSERDYKWYLHGFFA